jgi:hypothetical protein
LDVVLAVAGLTDDEAGFWAVAPEVKDFDRSCAQLVEQI